MPWLPFIACVLMAGAAFCQGGTGRGLSRCGALLATIAAGLLVIAGIDAGLGAGLSAARPHWTSLGLDGWNIAPVLTVALLTCRAAWLAIGESDGARSRELFLCGFLLFALLTSRLDGMLLALAGATCVMTAGLLATQVSSREPVAVRFAVPALCGVVILGITVIAVQQTYEWMQLDHPGIVRDAVPDAREWTSGIRPSMQHGELASLAWFRHAPLAFYGFCVGAWLLTFGFPWHGGLVRGISEGPPGLLAIWVAVQPVVVARLWLLVVPNLFAGELVSLELLATPVLVMLALAAALLALGQTDIRRLVGYGAFVWSNLAAAGLISSSPAAALAGWILLEVSGLAVSLTLLAVERLEQESPGRDLDAWSGLFHERPETAWMLLGGLGSAAGLAPLGGTAAILVLIGSSMAMGPWSVVGVLAAWGVLMWANLSFAQQWLGGVVRRPEIDSRLEPMIFGRQGESPIEPSRVSFGSGDRVVSVPATNALVFPRFLIGWGIVCAVTPILWRLPAREWRGSAEPPAAVTSTLSRVGEGLLPASADRRGER
ncbi:MAG: hypothetical protein KF777_04585 [Planctomycetaceae bacterium]|nr:hypothetical protein [Planctomycetaceae bacterium]